MDARSGELVLKDECFTVECNMLQMETMLS